MHQVFEFLTDCAQSSNSFTSEIELGVRLIGGESGLPVFTSQSGQFLRNQGADTIDDNF
jgi:hypothetical protein